MNSKSSPVRIRTLRSQQSSLEVRPKAATAPSAAPKPRPQQQPPIQELLPSLPFVARAVAEGLLKRDPESARKYVRQLVASNRTSF